MSVLVYFSIILLVGYLAGQLISLLKLPVITGYLIVGIIIGPFCLDIVPPDVIEHLSFLKHVTLAFIAFFIGSEFEKSQIKKLGKSVIIITIVQALGAVVLVTSVMFFIFHLSVSFSFLLGSISAATAPAAVLLVIKEYKARGPLTQTLLSVVALDDAICVILFGVTMSLVSTFNNGATLSVVSLLEPFWEIIGSVILGVFASIITFILIIKFVKNRESILTVTTAMIIGAAAIAYELHLSYLLTNMVFGAILANTNSKVIKVFPITEHITPPLYVAFFTLAGLTLELDLIPKMGLTGTGYILARASGKMIGCNLGARLGKAPDVVRKYLGLGMLPQAGVAIGLAVLAQERFPVIGKNLSAIVLAGVVFYEILGPLFAKIAIQKAQEAKI